MAVADKIKAGKELAIVAAQAVYHYKLIAMCIGYSEDQLKNWRDDDQDFSDRLEISRAEFLRKQMGRAKPEFLLERLERETFAPPTVKTEVSGGDPIKHILEKYDLKREDKDDGKNGEAVS